MRLCVLFLLAGVATGAESVIGVWNTASFDPFGYVAPGSLVRVQLKDAPLFFSFDPSDVSLQFQATGTDGPQHLRLTYISRSDWLEALIPYNAPLGPATLTLAFSGQTSTPFAIQVVASRFGLYTVNSGVAPAKATVNGQTLALTNPARPGDEVTLEGTGLGRAAVENITIRLGGHSVPIAGAGAGMSSGVDQVRFLLPDDPAIPDGCYVQVAVVAGGSFSNAATMPTARNGSACVHPSDLSFEEMQALDSGGELMFGKAAISSSIVPVAGSLRRLESAAVNYLAYNAVNVALAAPPLVADDSRLGCRVDEFRIGYGEGFSGKLLNVGESLTLAGNGKSLRLPGTPPLFLYQALASNEGPVSSPDNFSEPFFSPGTWQLSSPGSTAVAPFLAETRLPPQPRLVDFPSLRAVDRTQDFHVAWVPAGYISSDVMNVEISSGGTAAGRVAGSAFHQITCHVPAAEGGVTIPASSLQVLAADRTASLTVGISTASGCASRSMTTSAPAWTRFRMAARSRTASASFRCSSRVHT